MLWTLESLGKSSDPAMIRGGHPGFQDLVEDNNKLRCRVCPAHWNILIRVPVSLGPVYFSLIQMQSASSRDCTSVDLFCSVDVLSQERRGWWSQYGQSLTQATRLRDGHPQPPSLSPVNLFMFSSACFYYLPLPRTCTQEGQHRLARTKPGGQHL